jgi:hypothetical protein
MHPVHLERLVSDRQNDLRRSGAHTRSTAIPTLPGHSSHLRRVGVRTFGLLLIRMGHWMAVLKTPSRDDPRSVLGAGATNKQTRLVLTKKVESTS